MSAITITVERLRYGHQSCLREARVIAGPAYVLAHHTADNLAELTCSLAETGHDFSVEVKDRDVSLIEYMAATGRMNEMDAPLTWKDGSTA